MNKEQIKARIAELEAEKTKAKATIAGVKIAITDFTVNYHHIIQRHLRHQCLYIPH